MTGQDATVQGLQNILDGDQCMTVYKAIKKEADAAAAARDRARQGADADDRPAAVTVDPTSKANVPSVLLTPKAITSTTSRTSSPTAAPPRPTLCTGAYAAKCTAARHLLTPNAEVRSRTGVRRPSPIGPVRRASHRAPPTAELPSGAAASRRRRPR